jgi:hypothetical protein
MLSAAAFLAADDSSAKLLGRWRTLETSRGGIGTMFEFRKEGVVDYSPGAVVEMSYRVEGNELVLPPGTDKGPEQRQTITWLGDNKLRLRSPGEPEPGQELVRRGPRKTSPSPIVGEWAGSRDMRGRKVDVRYFFYPGGRGLLLIPFLTQQGSYATSNGTIHLDWPGCPTPDATFRVDDDVLTFTPAGSQPVKYARY